MVGERHLEGGKITNETGTIVLRKKESRQNVRAGGKTANAGLIKETSIKTGNC